MNKKQIEKKIEQHRLMVNKMLAKYGGITGDLKCLEHMKIANDLEEKLKSL